MRRNEPVTSAEYLLAPQMRLVSLTDIQGRILHCNPAFVQASGFESDELLGQPHNIVRHPDMPEAAFRDLWDTLKRGRPWTALVKNRRKSGDAYWVRAHVTPVMDGDTCVGYLSVRTFAQPQETEAAGRLYAELRRHEIDGTRAPWRMVEGRLQVLGLRGRLARMAASVGTRRLAIVPMALAGAGWLLGRWGGPMESGLMMAILLACFAVGYLERIYERPLRSLLAFAERVAAGDLRQVMTLDRTDVIGRLARALSQMNVNLQATIGDARIEVEQMNLALAELAAGSLDLSARTESQAASLEQTAAAMEQLTTTVANNTASATAAAALADSTASQSADGAQAADHLRGTMRSIDDASQRIATITQVIDAIAFQTNMLALNAAVEAARAGDQGRGFAVVAGEVRALSTRTIAAARDIKELIHASQSTVGAGVSQATRASALMAEGLSSVRRVSQFMRDIQRASDEQQLGITQSSEAVAHLDGITQQNAAMVEELSACAAALRGRAEVLHASMQVFRMSDAPAQAHPTAVELRRAACEASRRLPAPAA